MLYLTTALSALAGMWRLAAADAPAAVLNRALVAITAVASLGVGVPSTLLPVGDPDGTAYALRPAQDPAADWSLTQTGAEVTVEDSRRATEDQDGKESRGSENKDAEKDAAKGKGARDGGRGGADRNQHPPAPITPTPMEPARPTFTIVVGSWNTLGASHTEGRGCNRCHLPDSAARMTPTVQAINRHGLDVIGLQEFQPGQQAMFKARMPGWAVYANADNAVAWNTSTFEFVDATAFTIPYFGGNPRQMPSVRLRHRATGREIAVLSVHNPADVRGPAQRWRDRAVATEASVANGLTAADVPVFLTGDMNDRATFFCHITAASTLIASAGGSRTADSCTPPARMDVDWILGSAAHVTFTAHVSDDGPDVDFASDHPLIVATATIS